MQSLIAESLAKLRSRFAECSLIELSLIERSDGLVLVGLFEPRADGIVRRHTHKIADSGATPAVQRLALAGVLGSFEAAVRDKTRMERPA